MQQELVILIVTFPFFVSLALISCLKSHWKFKGEEAQNSRSEAYVRTLPVAVNETKPKKTEKKTKNIDGKEKKDKKGKKLANFFIFNGKDDDLKTAVVADLSLDSTQNSDDEHESPLGDSFDFSGDEKIRGIELLPSPPPDYVEKLRSRVRRARRGKKSPQDYYCSDEEDSLFNIPSLMNDAVTLKSSKSNVPLDIQDSRVLRIHQDRLGYKKSHTIYAHSSVSPFSNRMDRFSSASSNSGTDSEPTTVIMK